jgi:hypothetical protein
MKKYIAAALMAFPAIVGAQQLTNITTLIVQIRNIVNILIPLMFAIALLVFFYGVVKYIFSAGDEGTRERAVRIMLGGIIALFVIASVWGIVAFLGSALGINQGENIGNVPGVLDTNGGNGPGPTPNPNPNPNPTGGNNSGSNNNF